MGSINGLNESTDLSSGDLLVIYSTANGSRRKTSLTSLTTFLNSALTFPDAGIAEYETQRSAPSSTGFNVAITDSSVNTHLILTPSAGYAAGTITLPAVSNCIDKQRVLVNSTQQIDTLTIDGNGASGVVGEPAAMGADSFFTLKYDLQTKNWYRVG